MKPTLVWLVFAVRFWKVAFSELCQNEETKQPADISKETCPQLWSGEGAGCYNLVIKNETWQERSTNCSGFGAKLDGANPVDENFADNKNDLTLFLAIFQNTSRSGNRKLNWIWIDNEDYNDPEIWHSNNNISAFETNCSRILVVNETYDCYKLPCQDNCTFLCRECKNYTFEAVGEKGSYDLGRTRYDKEISQECKYGPSQKKITARCVDPENDIAAAQWKIDSEICWNRSVALAKISKVDKNNVQNVTKLLRNLTSHADTLASPEIGKISKILEDITNIDSQQDGVSDNFYHIVNNVLKARMEQLVNSQVSSNSSNRITEAVRKFSENLAFPNENQLNYTAIDLPNLAVSLVRVKSGSLEDVTFAENQGSVNVHYSQPAENQISKACNVSITLPKELLERIISEGKESKITFVLYRKVSFFKADNEPEKKTKNSRYIIAASVGGMKITQLRQAIVIRFLRADDVDIVNSKFQCVFWSYKKKSGMGGWSNDGCKYRRNKMDNYDECYCEHLTHFAILLEIDQAKQNEKHKKPLSFITYLGCSISLFGILLTVLTMIYFRELLAHVSSKILLNICLALGAALIAFLVAAEKSRASNVRCIAAGILTHFFFLSALSWMVFEAYTMYLAFVKVLPKAALEGKIPRFWLCCLICWGVPAVIVGITTGLALDSYGNEHHCFLQGTPMIVGFFAPVSVCITGNTITFLFIMCSLFKTGRDISSTKTRSGKEQARRGLAISVLLGLTWISGVLAVRDAKLMLQYIFCIVNSLQGWLIFVFYCLLSTDVRKKYWACCCQRDVSSASGLPAATMSHVMLSELDDKASSQKSNYLTPVETISCDIDKITTENNQRPIKKRAIK